MNLKTVINYINSKMLNFEIDIKTLYIKIIKQRIHIKKL